MINESKTVAICLATYNGEKYLSQQLDSILQQTYSNWHLYIRDDGSNDNTPNIIKEYVEKYPDKVTNLLEISGGGNSKKILKQFYVGLVKMYNLSIICSVIKTIIGFQLRLKNPYLK